MTKIQRYKLLQEAREIHTKLEENKMLYARLDMITQELVDDKFTEENGVALIDKFKDKNIQWKATGIRRFELDFSE